MFLYLNSLCPLQLLKHLQIQQTYKIHINPEIVRLKRRTRQIQSYKQEKIFNRYLPPEKASSHTNSLDPSKISFDIAITLPSFFKKPAKEARRTFPPKLIFDRKKPRVFAGINPRSLFYHFEGDLAIL